MNQWVLTVTLRANWGSSVDMANPKASQGGVGRGGDVRDFLKVATPAELESRVQATALWTPNSDEVATSSEGGADL